MRITTTIPGFTHYRWAVTRNGRTDEWHVQPSRRTRVGTSYGPPVTSFRRKVDARDYARRRNSEGRPVDADFVKKASVDTLDDLIRQAGLRVVFWTCPRGCRGFVDWAKDADGKKTPTCRECGDVGAPR